jgi:hypothetical protein
MCLHASHVYRRSDVLLPIEEAIIEKLQSGPCLFDDVVSKLSNFGWTEVSVAIERMSWDRRVSLLRLGYATYQLSLGSHSNTEALFHWADVERVGR